MFEISSLPEPPVLAEVDDATVVRGGIEGWLRVAAAVEARAFAAIADLARRRHAEDDDERNWWPADPWDSAGAEVAAAMNCAMGKARGRLETAILLRGRLPKTNALFLSGAITAYMATTINWRLAHVINDDAVWAQLDSALSDSHSTWGPLSYPKFIEAIDFWVSMFDPLAVRRTRDRARSRGITIGDQEDADGIVSLWGRMLGTDAELLRQQLTAMADGVCNDDPRTQAQRLADALGALAAKADFLACLCANPDCPASTGGDDGRGSNFAISIIADQAALALRPDPLIHGEGTPSRAPTPDPGPPANAQPPAGADPFVAAVSLTHRGDARRRYRCRRHCWSS
jgi:hypothetical protein